MPRREARRTSPGRIELMAAAIRRRRRGLGLTQVQLAASAGCGPDFVYDLERGKPTIRFERLLAVLAVLGLELRLIEGRGVLSVDEALAAERGTPARHGTRGPRA